MEMFWKLWVALYTPRQTYHTFFINQAPTTKKITTFSFIFNSYRRPPRSIFKYTLNDTANNSENLIRPSQASSFGTNHPTSAHFVLQPQNNLSELNNNLNIIVNHFSTCPTTRRKMPLRRHQTFNLATHSHACLLYFLVHPASTYISSTILITTTTIQSHWHVLLMVQQTSLRDRAHENFEKKKFHDSERAFRSQCTQSPVQITSTNLVERMRMQNCRSMTS